MKKMMFLFSLISLLCSTQTYTQWRDYEYCQTNIELHTIEKPTSLMSTALNALGISATTLSESETDLLKIIRENTTQSALVAALCKYYKEHEWPLQVARYKLPELSVRLTELNTNGSYTNDIALIATALELIAIGTVPFN